MGENSFEESKLSRKDFLKVTGTGFLGAALLGAAGCGGGQGGGGESRTLVLGHGADPGNPRSLAAKRFAEMVEKGTDGRIKIQIQGSEQLGSDVEMLESVQTGTLAITANSQGPLSNIVPKVALLGLPFLFSSPQDAYAVLDGDIGDELAQLSKEQGLVVLAWWDNGIRHITNNARPIKTPKDVRGLKIRTPEDPMTIDIFKALGANPTPIDFGELYLALRQGTVDGQENPIVNIWASKLYEVQKYLSLTGHKYEATPFIISPNTLDSLSQDDQKVVRDAAVESRDFQREQMLKQTQEQREKIAEKLQVNENVDTDAFRKATRSVYDQWREKHGDLVDRLSEAATAEQ